MAKILFVPISIVGCGKSTVFRALRSLCPSFAHVENDNFDNKQAFYSAVSSALAEPSTTAVLLDRNNHLPMHRKEIISKYKSDDVLVVALLFVPRHTSAQQMRSLVLNRIASRGDNHQQVKGKSDFGKAKMILNSFVKNFAPYNPEDHFDRQFDYVIEMDGHRESSEENVRRVVRFCQQVCPKISGMSQMAAISDAQIRRELQRSLAFQVEKPEAKPPAESGAE